jgi:uncharacterized protein (DUF58 family)
MPIPKYRYFDSSDAAGMSRLQFAAGKIVEGIVTGLHKSPNRGFSVEFSEHREYVPGDELRHLDWRAYARSDRHYIKLYEQETNLRATLVVDNSASMNFGKKLDYARHLAACISYLLAHQQDLAGLVASDESIRVELPPGSSPAHLDRLFRQLENLQAGKGTNLPAHLHDLAERLPQRSMVIIISDLWLDAGELARALQHVRYRRRHAMVLHLLDKAEIDLPYERQVTLEDLETGERIAVDAASLRVAYQENVRDYLASLRRGCSDCDVEYHAMYVHEPYDKALVRLLGQRR